MATTTRLHRRRMGEILVNEGLVSSEQLDEALAVQRSSGALLGAVLMDMGLVTESDIAKIICLQYQLPFMCLANYECDDKLVQLFPKEFLHRHRLFPFDKIGEMLLILVAEIPPDSVLAEIPRLTKFNLGLYVGYLSEVTKQLQTLVPLDENEQIQVMAEAVKEAKEAAPAPPRGATSAPTPAPPKKELKKRSAGRGEDDDADALVFGSQENFMADLNSTWDSIFEQATGDGPPQAKKPKKP